MTNSTNTPVTHFQSAWDKLPAPVQAALTAQGHTVVPDPIDTTPVVETPVTAAELVPALDFDTPIEQVNDLFNQDLLVEEEEEEDKGPRIFVNTTLKIGKFEIRIKPAELTSDFHLHNYRDGKKADKNKYMMSLIETIEKHGLAAVSEKMEIVTTISASGEGLDETVDLLEMLEQDEAKAKADEAK